MSLFYATNQERPYEQLLHKCFLSFFTIILGMTGFNKLVNPDIEPLLVLWLVGVFLVFTHVTLVLDNRR